jgi:hypothetical protein
MLKLRNSQLMSKIAQFADLRYRHRGFTAVATLQNPLPHCMQYSSELC